MVDMSLNALRHRTGVGRRRCLGVRRTHPRAYHCSCQLSLADHWTCDLFYLGGRRTLPGSLPEGLTEKSSTASSGAASLLPTMVALFAVGTFSVWPAGTIASCAGAPSLIGNDA